LSFADTYVSNENENLVDNLINLIESEKIAEDYIEGVTECVEIITATRHLSSFVL
jgi:hypothetical protein